MKRKLFQRIFLASMAVFVLTVSVLLFFMLRSIPGDAHAVFRLILQLFTPLLIVVALAVVLAAVMASRGAKVMTEPLNRIDFSRPDERDVEEELRPLVRRLAEQNRQIRQQMEDLAQEHEKQDRLRREFTANVSHELKTPLTSISGFAELMRDGMVRPEDVPRFAGKVYDEAQRLISLVEDILRLSRLDDRAAAPAPEALSLYERAALVLEQLEPVARRQNVALCLEGSPGEILGVRQMVDEMIYNLCDNAIKYNRPGGQVRVRVSDGPDGAAVAVSDTGIGIPEEELPRIFERFYRVDKSHSKEMGGTGLGLSIVKHVAIYHEAAIDVDSKLGSGTSVTVTFPPSRGAEPLPDPRDPAPPRGD